MMGENVTWIYNSVIGWFMASVPAISKCPHCGKALLHVNGGFINVSIPGGIDRKGILYSCPSCLAALSVEIDPLAVKTEIVAEIARLLGRH
jgi:hypothetical protein